MADDITTISTESSLVAGYAAGMRRETTFQGAQEVAGDNTNVAGLAYDTWFTPLESITNNMEALYNDSLALEWAAQTLELEDESLGQSIQGA